MAMLLLYQFIVVVVVIVVIVVDVVVVVIVIVFNLINIILCISRKICLYLSIYQGWRLVGFPLFDSPQGVFSTLCTHSLTSFLPITIWKLGGCMHCQLRFVSSTSDT